MDARPCVTFQSVRAGRAVCMAETAAGDIAIWPADFRWVFTMTSPTREQTARPAVFFTAKSLLNGGRACLQSAEDCLPLIPRGQIATYDRFDYTPKLTARLTDDGKKVCLTFNTTAANNNWQDVRGEAQFAFDLEEGPNILLAPLVLAMHVALHRDATKVWEKAPSQPGDPYAKLRSTADHLRINAQ